MPEPIQRVRLEEIDWTSALPMLRLFRSFRMAIQPAKLLVALLLVLGLYLGGWVLDAASGASTRVYAGELERFATLSDADFRTWLATRDDWVKDRLYNELKDIVDTQTISDADVFARVVPLIDQYYARKFTNVKLSWLPQTQPGQGPVSFAAEYRQELDRLRAERLRRVRLVHELKPQGVFAAALKAELDGFERLIRAATSLEFGINELVGTAPHNPRTVSGALRDMLVSVPVWMARRHPGYLAIYAGFALMLWALLGGTLARMAALDAANISPVGAGRALKFTVGRWPWLILAPLLPLLLVVMMGVVLAVGGAVFFNFPGTDIVGGLTFPVVLVLGVLIAILLVGLGAGFNLLFPAVAVEGTDGIDAVSRSFNYVYRQPWKWACSTIIALVYGAICYLFLTVLVFLALKAVHGFVGMLVFTEAAPGINRFDAIMPDPSFGSLSYDMDGSVLGPTAKVAGVLTGIWVHLLIGLLAAFAVSFYFCANTWIYLLLRQGSDATALEDVTLEAGAATGRPLNPPTPPTPPLPPSTGADET